MARGAPEGRDQVVADLDVMRRELGAEWWRRVEPTDLGKFSDTELVHWMDSATVSSAIPQDARDIVDAALKLRGIEYESPARRLRRVTNERATEQEQEVAAIERTERTGDNKPEPDPEANESRPIAELVAEDLIERMKAGTRKYGTPLQAHNGRLAMRDAYQELMDLVCYVKQHLVEEDSEYRPVIELLAELVVDYAPLDELQQRSADITPFVWLEISAAIERKRMAGS